MNVCRSFCLRNGAYELPSTPMISVVTPWWTFGSCFGSARIMRPEWAWKSMKPGQTTRPVASIRRFASVVVTSPRRMFIVSPSIPTAPGNPTLPDPSIICPPAISTSNTVGLKLPSRRSGMRLKIRNGTLITSRGQLREDVVCDDGVIERIGQVGSEIVDEEIDARGMLVFPGFIDPHVHSRDPGLTHKEDFAHSTRAAAAGGGATLLEMPDAIPPGHPP